MFNSLPATAQEFMQWSWGQIEPYYRELEESALDSANITSWLANWTRLNDLITEWYARLNVALTVDTTDPQADASYHAFLDGIYQLSQAAEQKLKRKFVEAGIEPAGFELPARKMRLEAEIYRSENLPLLAEERKLASEYNKVIGAQTVGWQGGERTIQQMRLVLQNGERGQREKAWRLAAARQLADRQAINELWRQFLPLRTALAGNAGKQNYRDYRWAQMLRIDYNPHDCEKFHDAIEKEVVPAATRLYNRQRSNLGVTRLRPWDLDQDLYPIHQPALPGYGDIDDLQSKAQAVFEQVDPLFGEYFERLRGENMLDLENRKGKAPGAYCTGFPVLRLPFIFMNAVGMAGDIRTILHETGHAFHNFERIQLPYAQQRNPGLEFAEVASMAMELLALPYLHLETGGFYSKEDASRFRVELLEHILVFWPYMAVVDAFQHWVYTHAKIALDPLVCDAKWFELWGRFIPGVDWSDLEAEAMTGWHRKQHIFRYPFYYIEYGLAQLGAVQVWQKALQDQISAVKNYRQALALGGTESLGELYKQAGARLAFDGDTLKQAVELIETQLT